MNRTQPEGWLPEVPGLKIDSITGAIWPDGWMTREVCLGCTALADLCALELQAWNPDWSAVYAHNVVTLSVDGDKVFTPELYMGEPFQLKVARPVASGERVEIRISSNAARPGDVRDSRELSIVLALLRAHS